MSLQKPDAQTRLLLMLWYLGGVEGAIDCTRLIREASRSRERSQDFKDLLEHLNEKGAVVQDAEAGKVRLQPYGIACLSQGLQDPHFEFGGSVVSSHTTNAILRWNRQKPDRRANPDKEEIAPSPIESYEDFKAEVLALYERLNVQFKLDDLVAIYRLRRGIGDRVDYSQFDEWLLQMQEEELLDLRGGTLPSDNPQDFEDSLDTQLTGLRCYAKRLEAAVSS